MENVLRFLDLDDSSSETEDLCPESTPEQYLQPKVDQSNNEDQLKPMTSQQVVTVNQPPPRYPRHSSSPDLAVLQPVQLRFPESVPEQNLQPDVYNQLAPMMS